jgi:hypothetical protein
MLTVWPDRELLEALKEGSLVAIRNRVEIPSAYWFGSDVVLSDDLRFRRAEMLKRWKPISRPVADSPTPDQTGSTALHDVGRQYDALAERVDVGAHVGADRPRLPCRRAGGGAAARAATSNAITSSTRVISP